MCTSQVQGATVEELDDHALLDLIEQGLAVLGARPLDGDVDDTSLACRVERLHRLETAAAAEKLRRVAAGAIPSRAGRGGPKAHGRPPTCSRDGCG